MVVIIKDSLTIDGGDLQIKGTLINGGLTDIFSPGRLTNSDGTLINESDGVLSNHSTLSNANSINGTLNNSDTVNLWAGIISNCSGAYSETSRFGAPFPPCDRILGNWSEWSGCDAKCVGGVQSRSRAIVQESRYGGNPCAGALVETQNCSTQACPDPCHDDRSHLT